MNHPRPIKIVLLPGMDGTGRLFERFVEVAPEGYETVVISLPNKRVNSYEELADEILPRVPQTEPYLLLGESVSGPLVLELTSRRLEGLVGVIMVASFIRSPQTAAFRW